MIFPPDPYQLEFSKNIGWNGKDRQTHHYLKGNNSIKMHQPTNLQQQRKDISINSMTSNCLLLSVMAPSLAHKVTFGSNCCTCGWEKLPLLLVCILKGMLVYSPNNSPRLPVWRIGTIIVALLLITSYYSLLQLVGLYQSNLKIVSSTTHLDPMLSLSLLLKESIHLIWNTELAWSCTLSEKCPPDQTPKARHVEPSAHCR